MYSQLKESPKKAGARLMINKGKTLVVLFNEANMGIVVHATTLSHKIGTIQADWAMDQFQPFDGVVELSNEKL
jgi:hypothetical protein